MIDTLPLLSEKLGPLAQRVESLVRDTAEIWRSATAGPAGADRVFSSKERQSCESEFSKLFGEIAEAAKSRSSGEHHLSADGLERLADGLRPLFGRLLGAVDLPLETVYDARFVESTRRFIGAARDFDPELGIDAVYQALRNVWIMNTLQFILGRPVEYTDAVFGYSMVYPYLDNLLDDPGAPASAKISAVSKIKDWLEGADTLAENPVEDKIRRLIGRVENTFARDAYPGVFRSMLTIYNAQVRSLTQQQGRSPREPADILAISLEKGGTSVLADGYLAAGRLDPAEEDFCFGFGTFLQFADDLQDVSEDIRNGHATVFTEAARLGVLDAGVRKLQGYIDSVLEKNGGPGNDRMAALSPIIRRACILMNIGSVGRHPDYFSRGFLRSCQRIFPVRFSYLRKAGRKLPPSLLNGRRRIRDIDPALTAFLTVSSRALSLS